MLRVPNIEIIALSVTLAVQLRFKAVGVLIADVDLVAVEGQRPHLSFAVPQDAAFNLKNVLTQPSAPGGIDAIKCRRTFAKHAIQADLTGKSLGKWSLSCPRFARTDPGRSGST